MTEKDRNDVLDWLNQIVNPDDVDWREFYSDSEICLLAKNTLVLLNQQENDIHHMGLIIEEYEKELKKCGHHVGNMIKNKVADVHENFCSSCGQAVKWE